MPALTNSIVRRSMVNPSGFCFAIDSTAKSNSLGIIMSIPTYFCSARIPRDLVNNTVAFNDSQKYKKVVILTTFFDIYISFSPTFVDFTNPFVEPFDHLIFWLEALTLRSVTAFPSAVTQSSPFWKSSMLVPSSRLKIKLSTARNLICPGPDF